MRFRILFLLFTGAGLTQTAVALSLPFSPASKDQVSDDEFNFQNINNVTISQAIYTTELEVAGQKFNVQLDSGSSDFWLDTNGIDLSGFMNTGVESSISYLDGTGANGPVLIGNVTMGDFSVSQAFISAPGSNATLFGDKGLLGVGPPQLSVISRNLNRTAFNGKVMLENVFDADPTLDRFISFALSRSEMTGTTGGGVFTIGEIASNLTGVSQSPKLDVILKTRWTVLMDGIVVNGRKFSGGSAFLDFDVPNQTANQTWANLDTGTGLSLIPQSYADAIYGSVPGAQFDTQNGLYVVPCNAKINVSFVFGGIKYPVHPIDTVQATLANDGSVSCFSGFPINPDPTQTSEDFLLGDSFMRNIYAVFNFGSFISGTDRPTVQLLGTTDRDQAFAEFETLSAQRNQSLLQNGSSSFSTASSSDVGPSTDTSALNGNSAMAVVPPGLAGRWLALLALVALGKTLIC